MVHDGPQPNQIHDVSCSGMLVASHLLQQVKGSIEMEFVDCFETNSPRSEAKSIAGTKLIARARFPSRLHPRSTRLPTISHVQSLPSRLPALPHFPLLFDAVTGTKNAVVINSNKLDHRIMQRFLTPMVVFSSHAAEMRPSGFSRPSEHISLHHMRRSVSTNRGIHHTAENQGSRGCTRNATNVYCHNPQPAWRAAPSRRQPGERHPAQACHKEKVLAAVHQALVHNGARSEVTSGQSSLPLEEDVAVTVPEASKVPSTPPLY